MLAILAGAGAKLQEHVPHAINAHVALQVFYLKPEQTHREHAHKVNPLESPDKAEATQAWDCRLRAEFGGRRQLPRCSLICVRGSWKSEGKSAPAAAFELMLWIHTPKSMWRQFCLLGKVTP